MTTACPAFAPQKPISVLSVLSVRQKIKCSLCDLKRYPPDKKHYLRAKI